MARKKTNRLKQVTIRILCAATLPIATQIYACGQPNTSAVATAAVSVETLQSEGDYEAYVDGLHDRYSAIKTEGGRYALSEYRRLVRDDANWEFNRASFEASGGGKIPRCFESTDRHSDHLGYSIVSIPQGENQVFETLRVLFNSRTCAAKWMETTARAATAYIIAPPTLRFARNDTDWSGLEEERYVERAFELKLETPVNTTHVLKTSLRSQEGNLSTRYIPIRFTPFGVANEVSGTKSGAPRSKVVMGQVDDSQGQTTLIRYLITRDGGKELRILSVQKDSIRDHRAGFWDSPYVTRQDNETILTEAIYRWASNPVASSPGNHKHHNHCGHKHGGGRHKKS